MFWSLYTVVTRHKYHEIRTEANLENPVRHMKYAEKVFFNVILYILKL